MKNNTGNIPDERMKIRGELAKEIANGIYVDNVFVGASDSEKAFRNCQEAKSLFMEALMNFREWRMNREVNQRIEEVDLMKEERTNVLGIRWKYGNRYHRNRDRCGKLGVFTITKKGFFKRLRLHPMH